MADVYLSCGVRQVGDSEEPLQDLFVKGTEALLAEFSKSYPGKRLEAIVLTSAHGRELNGVSADEACKAVSAYLRTKGLSIPVFYSHKPAPYAEDANLAASSAGAALLHEGIQSVAFGERYSTIGLVAAEQMRTVPSERSIEVLRALIHPEEAKYGLTMPALGALMTEIAMCRDPLVSPAMKHYSAFAHTNGSRNPRTQLRKAFTVEEYLASDKNVSVSTPLRLYDVAPRSSGYAALVASRHAPADEVKVKVAGYGQGTDTLALTARESFHRSRATLMAMEQLKEMVDLTQVRVSYAEMHDAFFAVLYYGLQDTALLPVTGVSDLILQGALAPGGKLPTNLSGGVMCGHALAASGLGQVVELLRQAKGESEIAVENLQYPHYAMALSVGGLHVYNCLTLLHASKDSGRSFHLKPIPEITAKDLDLSIGKLPDGPFHARVYVKTKLHYPPPGFTAPLTIALCFCPLTDSYFFAQSLAEDLAEGQFVLVDRNEKGLWQIASSKALGVARAAPPEPPKA